MKIITTGKHCLSESILMPAVTQVCVICGIQGRGEKADIIPLLLTEQLKSTLFKAILGRYQDYLSCLHLECILFFTSVQKLM